MQSDGAAVANRRWPTPRGGRLASAPPSIHGNGAAATRSCARTASTARRSDTPEGRAAKRFVEGLLRDAAEAIVATSMVDKYDRYLADVYIVTTAGEKVLLNQALLAQGHAVPMGAEGAGEW